MIPTIGLMIAAYIVTRMLDIMLSTPGQPHGKWVIASAVVTIAWTAICAYSLIDSSISVPNLPQVQ